jgi:hypothetical protein
MRAKSKMKCSEVIAGTLKKSRWSWAVCQPLIPTAERFGLLSRTAAMAGALSCTHDKTLSAFVELERQVLTVTFYLESIDADS